MLQYISSLCFIDIIFYVQVHHILLVCSSTDRYLGCCQFLNIMNIVMNICILFSVDVCFNFFCMDICFHLSGVYNQEENGWVISKFHVFHFGKLPNCFSKQPHHFTFPPIMYKLSTSFSISLPTCIIVSFLKNVSIFSCAYLSSTISALVKQIKSLAHFKNNDFLIVMFETSLCILTRSSLSL